MAKKGNTPPKAPPQKKAPPPPAQRQGAVSSRQGLNDTQWNLVSIAGILIVVAAFLWTCLQNQFTNWDDPGYVLNDPLVKDMSSGGIGRMFALSNSVMGNYHPLTILTYAIDYASSGLEPQHYHVQSLLFHLLTTALVYLFVWSLTRKRMVAVITALFFGLHPMHIESVAWVSGRKDVVYGAFYMASCISYLGYIRSGQGGKRWLWYAGVFLLYACSLLSKPVAVVLPVTLLLIDFFEGRLWRGDTSGQSQSRSFAINVQVIVEKLPLFLLSILAGIQSVIDQKKFGALNTQGDHFNALERIGLGGYALFTYLWKLLWPVKLLCFYPYPLKEEGHLAPVYYIYPVIALSLLVMVWMFWRRNKGVMFGVLFFLVNIALLLQFIPVGGAIIADRYTYIPYIGLFFVLGWGINYLLENKSMQSIGKGALVGVAVYAAVLGYMANERCKVWYDGMSLWRDVIEIEPVRAPNGYNNLGFFYFNKFNAAANMAEKKLYYDSSYYLLNKAIELQPSFVNPYISLGELLRSNNQLNEAKIYYYKALKLDSGDMAANAYLGLSVIYSIGYMNTPPDNVAARQFFNDSALFCYNKTLTLKPYNPEAHSNYANFLDMSGRREDAIKEYGVAVQQNPDIYQPYLNRARALQRLKRYPDAMKDFDKAISLEPKLAEVYVARANCFAEMGNAAMMQKDMESARKLGYNGPPH